MPQGQIHVCYSLGATLSSGKFLAIFYCPCAVTPLCPTCRFYAAAITSLLCLVCLSDFSNVICKSDVKSLAEADEQEVVAEVQVKSNLLNGSLLPKVL